MKNKQISQHCVCRTHTWSEKYFLLLGQLFPPSLLFPNKVKLKIVFIFFLFFFQNKGFWKHRNWKHSAFHSPEEMKAVQHSLWEFPFNKLLCDRTTLLRRQTGGDARPQRLAGRHSERRPERRALPPPPLTQPLGAGRRFEAAAVGAYWSKRVIHWFHALNGIGFKDGRRFLLHL